MAPTTWIREHRLVAFFVLAHAIAWAGWPFWAAGLLPEPLFLPCGPLVAALLVIAATEGRGGYRALGQRMVRWRVGWAWWVVALGLPLALVAATGLLNTVAGAPAPALGQLPWGSLALLFGLYLVNPLGGALGEEPGWRGHALPGLLAARSPLVSVLVLGVLVAGWHLPLVVFGMLGPIGLLSTAAITVVYSWLFHRTGGSALLTLVFHAVQDSFTFGALGYTGPDLVRAEYLYCAVVVTFAVYAGTRLPSSGSATPSGSGTARPRRGGRPDPAAGPVPRSARHARPGEAGGSEPAVAREEPLAADPRAVQDFAP